MTPSKPAHQIDYSSFIRFHPSANGTNGRIVYIDPKLIPRFIELIDPECHIGLQVVQGLAGLKNSAAGVGSDSNQNNSMQHRSTFHNVVAVYTMLQHGGRGAGVYITDLQYGYTDDPSRPGLYKVVQNSMGRNRWAAEPDGSQSMPSTIGVLGALPPSEIGAVSALKTANAFADLLATKERRNINNGFSLFYTPTYVIDGIGVWLTANQKTTNDAISCPKGFAQLLANSENKTSGSEGPERYKWYIVGQGAKIFQKALKEYKALSKYPLNRSHEFYFVDPQVPLGLLKEDLRNNGIDFYHDRNILEDQMTLASKMHQFFDPTKTYFNLHRAYTLEKTVNASAEEAGKIYKASSSYVYFCDLVKKLSSALNRRWV